jgi:hypothetical protein
MTKRRENEAALAEYHHSGAYSTDLAKLPRHTASDHVLAEVRGLAFFDLDDLVQTELPNTALCVKPVSVMRRAAFVACLYFELLFDQALHEYFPAAHSVFAKQHAVPKFGHVGMGPRMHHPNELLRGSCPSFVGARKHLEQVLPSAAVHFMTWPDAFVLPVSSRDVWQAAVERDWGDLGVGALRECGRALEDFCGR